jgi:hypothetical protein
MVPGGNVDHQSEVTALSRQPFSGYISLSPAYTLAFSFVLMQKGADT